MIEAVSCGGVVIHKNKILLLYKNYKHRYYGWVLPKGTVEQGEEFEDTAVREVKEETSASAKIMKYVGKSQYSFKGMDDLVVKNVHWFLMQSNNFYCKPQKEEHFEDAGYYKYHEAYHLLKFNDERQIMERAYKEYLTFRNKRQFFIQ